MGRNILLIIAILVIIGGAAFVYFDPLDMDILGLKAAAPKAPPVAAPGAKPPVAPPKAAVAPAPAPAPVAALPQAVTPVAPAPAATPQVATLSVAKPGQVSSPPLLDVKNIQTENKPSKPGKPTASKPAINKRDRPKDQDLRHCLELESPQAIAKCAGELE